MQQDSYKIFCKDQQKKKSREKIYEFQFDYDRVNNSYYSLVKGETT
jgi:hypothetical protein